MPRAKRERTAYQKLTLRQRRFVDAYLGLANGNASEAARQAGYGERAAGKIAYELLRENPLIQAAIEERMAGNLMSANEAMSRLSDLARQEPNPTVRVKALELVGKFHSLFTEKSDVQVTINPFDGWSEEDLEKYARGDDRSLGSATPGDGAAGTGTAPA